jgi:hypothetical protein
MKKKRKKKRKDKLCGDVDNLKFFFLLTSEVRILNEL